MASMFKTPSDIRNYTTTESPHSSQHSSNSSNVASESTACSSTTCHAWSVGESSLSSCLSGKNNVPPTCSYTDTSCSSTTSHAWSVGESSLSSCLSEKNNVPPTCSYTDTSVTTVRTTNRCEEIVREMFPSLEQEKITQALSDCNMNVQEAIYRILGETGTV